MCQMWYCSGFEEQNTVLDISIPLHEKVCRISAKNQILSFDGQKNETSCNKLIG